MSKYPKPKKKKYKKIHITKLLRNAVIVRDGGLCRICKQSAVDLHHMQFKSLGGNDTAYNLVCLCRECHSKVHKYQQKYFKILYASQKEIYRELEKEMLKK